MGSPGGKTPSSRLYAGLARSIKDLGKSSTFGKTERGKFEVKILSKHLTRRIKLTGRVTTRPLYALLLFNCMILVLISHL